MSEKKETSYLEREFGRFCEWTTCHGFGQMNRQTDRHKRRVWCLIVIAIIFVNIYQLSRLVQQYVRYDTEDKQSHETKRIRFPSVTICNLDPMSALSIQNVVQHKLSLPRFWRYDLLMDDLIKRELIKTRNQNRTRFFAYGELLTTAGYAANMGRKEATLFGHQMHDMILHCMYDQRPCDYTWDFYPFFDTTLLNCYSFNPVLHGLGKRRHRGKTSRLTGHANGLSLIIYTESYVSPTSLNASYMLNRTYVQQSNIYNGAGLHVQIHPPGTLPIPGYKGVQVAPGHSANIEMTYHERNRLKPPYGHCTTKHLNDDTKFSYDDQICRMICHQKFINKKCGCLSATLPIPESMKNQGFCGVFPLEKSNISLQELNQVMEDKVCEYVQRHEYYKTSDHDVTCDCPPPCQETSYALKVGYAKWPMSYYQQDFYRQFILENINRTRDKVTLAAYEHSKHLWTKDPQSVVTSQFVENNFLRVNVFMGDLTARCSNEQERYGAWSLFSDIGGCLGLFVGVSVLTLIEIVSLLVRLVVYYAAAPCMTVYSYCWPRRGGSETADYKPGDQTPSDVDFKSPAVAWVSDVYQPPTDWYPDCANTDNYDVRDHGDVIDN